MTPAPTLAELIATVEADAGSADPLDRLATAAATSGELVQAGDDLLGHYVEQCRAAGRTWTEISAALGVTKQAAHKRFSVSGVTAPTMERFTERARLSLAAATTAAKDLGHTFVGTEHLLLGLFAPEGTVAERILTSSGLTRAQVVAAVTARMGTGTGAGTGTGTGTGTGAGSSTEPPYTPRAAAALAGALSEALELGHNYIGTEHLLLGLFRAPEGVAAQVLTDAGLSAEGLRAKVVELLAGYKP